ncbi:MAG: host attachment protein [Pseudomonadales bacterium]|jgi:protein required for attachment to host cells|nr:host attachment protein [Pseudomonadales bacterium]
MEKEAIRIVVADGSRARVFVSDHATGDLQEREGFLNPEQRQREQDQVSDRPGRAFDSSGSGRHAMEPPTSAAEQAIERFAAQLAASLDHDRAAGAFSRLGLVAGPHMLGVLRKAIGKETARTLAFSLDKDLVRLDAASLREKLPKRLFTD